MAKKQYANIARIFADLDADQDGYIDALEFNSIVNELAPNGRPPDLHQAFRLIDLNSDGLIDFAEFVRWWSSHQGEA